MCLKGNKVLRIVALAIAFLMVASLFPAYNQDVYGATNREKENNNSYDRANKIVAGTEYVGRISNREDVDWYKLDVTQDGYINLSVNSKYTEKEYWRFYIFKKGKTGDNDYIMNYDKSGKDGATRSPNLGLKKGTYYVKVQRYYATSEYLTDYKFKVNFKKAANWEVENNDTKATANTMKSGVKYYGALSGSKPTIYEDIDYYKIVMTKPGRVKLSFHSSNTGGSWDISLQNASGNTTYVNEYLYGNDAPNFATPYIGLNKGTYYVKIDGSYNTTGYNYDLKAEWAYSNVWEKEKNDNTGIANTIKLGTKYYGSITRNYGDDDYYKFTIPADGYISIPVARNAAKQGSLKYEVLKSDGKTVLMDFKLEANEKSKTSPPLGLAKGTYFLHVENWLYWNPNTYSFSINFKKSNFWEKELNNGFGGATSVKVNTKYYASSHKYSDEDYYKFTLGKKDTITISLGHPNSEYSWGITIYDSKKQKVFNGSIRGSAASPTVSDKVTLNKGTYYLEIDPNWLEGKTYNFTINTGQSQKISLEKARVTGVVDKTYTGKAQTQNPKVVVNGRVLSPGTDYALTYENNVKPGFARVYITGRGKYVGSTWDVFSIVKRLDRIAGNNRFDTGTRIANKIKSISGAKKFKNIVVACGTNYPDALAGAYLADQKGAPIILTANAQVRLDETLKYIQSNLASGGRVYILGGPNAVPESLINSLKKRKINYTRLGGRSRYDTNVLTLKAVGIKNKELLVCTGTDFPDALISSATGRPIMIVNPVTGLSESQKDLLKKNKVRSVTIIGSASSVPASVANQLKAASKVSSVGRVSATNRYEMSTKVANKYFTRPKSVVVATGKEFADALTGGPLALKMDGPLLLVGEKQSEYKFAKDYVKKKGITQGVVLGGTKAVSDATSKQIM